MASGPGIIPAGTTRDDLIDVSDFFPTLAELAGAPLPAGVTLDGRSFAPQLHGSDKRHRDWVFAEGGRGRFLVRNERWKLYDDGRLINMAEDPGEKASLRPKQDTPASLLARRQLQAVIETLP